MRARISTIASNTFREAVRDRVLYNLIVFAVLMVGAALVLGQITVDIERLFLINMGLSAISIFGAVIAIFIGIGLVSKEIEKKTLYTILSRPVRRWEFIVGKFLGLNTTLLVNTAVMAGALFVALLPVSYYHWHLGDAELLVAIYFIMLQFMMMISLALLFSSFSSPILSAVFSFALFIVGSFAQDLRLMAASSHGAVQWMVRGVSYLVPNLASLNVITSVSHGQAVAGAVIVHNTLYAVLYSAAVVAGAVLIFERRNLK
jgi:ABC-type transport system involved in multi-copper enzyme maturation permease subunit